MSLMYKWFIYVIVPAFSYLKISLFCQIKIINLCTLKDLRCVLDLVQKKVLVMTFCLHKLISFYPGLQTSPTASYFMFVFLVVSSGIKTAYGVLNQRSAALQLLFYKWSWPLASGEAFGDLSLTWKSWQDFPQCSYELMLLTAHHQSQMLLFFFFFFFPLAVILWDAWK